MNISGIFIRRPIMTTLVMLAILFFGVAGYRALPVSELPNVDFPTIVEAPSLRRKPGDHGLGGGLPLENSSHHRRGRFHDFGKRLGPQITLQFDLDRDIDAAARDVQIDDSEASRQLPNEPSPLRTGR
jgi:HAE1 family hydrophobic/amphiphilic exporter-1